MKDFVAFLAKGLVDRPNEVDVQGIEGEGDQDNVVELRVAQDELGKVIGKQGRTARVLRILVSAASSKMEKRTLLEIIE
ncbi:MAG: KH domain-containing protein [Desulfovibrionaceae bacterium]|nr:KH domain-containing protein [Desulfovibrionaceae bacterium]